MVTAPFFNIKAHGPNKLSIDFRKHGRDLAKSLSCCMLHQSYRGYLRERCHGKHNRVNFIPGDSAANKNYVSNAYQAMNLKSDNASE
jgi:hypothetical protein